MATRTSGSMTYIAAHGAGGPDVLRPAQGEVPVPGPNELLVQVAAAGVNRPDVLQRQGSYPPPPDASPILGLEVSGTVAATGAGTTRFAVGDKVCALTNGGGYAEFVTVPEAQALPVPAGLTMVEAAALPETCFTVWTNVFERGRLAGGETLLVHGGSSGIGTTAIQIAAARGARVFATAGSERKVRICEELGAVRGIDYHREDFVEIVKSETGGKGIDVILDMVGGSYVGRNLKAAAVNGRIVQIAWLQSPRIETDMTLLMVKRLHWTGSTLRARSFEEKGLIAGAVEREVWPLVEAGKMRPLIDTVVPFREAARAHAVMDEGQHIGKIMLQLDEAG